MLSAEQVKDKIEKAIPNIRLVSVKDYGTDYLVTYRMTDNSECTDPFLLVNKKTEEIKYYTIALDLDRYYSTPSLI